MRADKFFAEKFGSRTKAANAINKGLVLVNGKKIVPSNDISESDTVEFIDADESFVSAGGFKLSKALKEFGFSAKDKVFADIGASTGGFTDCLIQNGARKVYCIDVGESQLDKSLLSGKTVVIDNFNARNLNMQLFNENLDGVVIDVSFISLTYILKQVSDVIGEGAYIIALIKPQFECENRNIGKNGIVKDRKAHEKAISKVYDYGLQCNLIPEKITNAPIIQGKNMEYLMLFRKNTGDILPENNLFKSVKL
jgi:23S rRNA (cytidine1920-2'-O)/16S rRNA (cytidine1409-2'-O)-methyltransferase